MKKRLFIAVKINTSDSLLKLLEELRTSLNKEKIKWIDQDHLHLTLTFLGDTEEFKIPRIISIMDGIIESKSPFNMKLKSVGVFKSIDFPTILWIGIESDRIMHESKMALDSALKKIGFTIEKREFKPHLTVGRIKNIVDKKNLELLLKKFVHEEITNQTVDEITLFESVLSSEGPTYKIIHISKTR